MDDIDKRDRYEERAASLEFDGEMRRSAAEAKAWKEIYDNSVPQNTSK